MNLNCKSYAQHNDINLAKGILLDNQYPILNDIIHEGMNDEEKALAIYKFCVSHFAHVEHLPGPDTPIERNTGLVHDALKLFTQALDIV